MQYSFHPKAEIEFNISVDYYAEYKQTLGLEFANEVYRTVQRIVSFPNAWQILDGDIRRCLTNRFPFGIIYFQKNNEIIILAVMQLNKSPNYWKNRV